MILSILVFIFSQSLIAATISGQLLEKGTRNKLADTKIFILPHKLSAITDQDGHFTFEQVPDGDFTWVINSAGYQKLELADQTQSPIKTLYLERITYQVYETTVTGKIKKRDDSTQTLTQDQFLMAPGAGYDPVKAVQNLTGVAQTQSAQIIIQGANPDDTKYMVNQHQIPLVFHFGGLSSIVMPNAVESVDYLSAGYGPEYGRAIGGLVGLNTRAPKTDRYHGLAYVDIFNSGALFEGPIKKNQSFLISARRSYIGQVLSRVLKDKEDFNFTVAPTYSDVTAIYQNKINEKNLFKMDVIGSQDELKFVLNKPVGNDPNLRGNFYQKTEFFRFIPRYLYDINAKSQFDTSIGVGPDHLIVKLNNQYLDIKALNLTTRTEYRNEFSPRFKFFTGFDTITTKNDVGVNLPKTYSNGGVSNGFSSGETAVTRLKSTSGQYAWYVRNELKSSENSPLTISPNLRYEYFENTQDSLLSPRLNGRYTLTDSLTLRAASGIYYQSAKPQEQSPDFGNPGIKPPKAVHLSAGFTKDFRQGSSEGFIWSSGFFYKKLSDLVIQSNKFTVRDGQTIKENFNNEGTGLIHGLENNLKYRFQDYSFTVAYTLLKSYRTEPNTSRHSSEYDQTHNVNLIASMEKGKWTYSSRFRYVTGNPMTPVIGSYYDADNNTYIPVRGPIYSSRLNDFMQLDVRIDRKFVFNQWLLFAYLDIQNITSHKNEQQINYSYDYSQKQATVGLPILPTFGLRGEF